MSFQRGYAMPRTRPETTSLEGTNWPHFITRILQTRIYFDWTGAESRVEVSGSYDTIQHGKNEKVDLLVCRESRGVRNPGMLSICIF